MKSTGFSTPNRPKNLKSKIQEVLKISVQERIEANQLEDRYTHDMYYIRTQCAALQSAKICKKFVKSLFNFRDESEMWLVRHLELIRKFTVDDLRIAKTLCVKVFPPHYNIFEFYINLYREAISNRLEEIIEQGLQNQEHVTILNWATQEYPGMRIRYLT